MVELIQLLVVNLSLTDIINKKKTSINMRITTLILHTHRCTRTGTHPHTQHPSRHLQFSPSIRTYTQNEEDSMDLNDLTRRSSGSQE